jgi:hypothetical protein
MRKFMGVSSAVVIGSCALIGTGASSPAAAAIKGGAPLLSVCIANLHACQANCNFYFPLPPPNTCTSMCDNNHAACVDLAFGTRAAARRSQGKTPRHVQSPRMR